MSRADHAPHVVIIGAGFGGLTAAKSLHRAPVRVTIIDRSNHHLFQPLLYQVAMAGLSPAEIAMPIRSIVSRQKNTSVLLGEVTAIDLASKQITVRNGVTRSLPYDYLVIAAGARTNFFGHDEWAEHSLGLKDLDDAVEIRRQVLVAYEAAEREQDPERRKELLTFVVIGGGPTGVELAGALCELSRHVLAKDFRVVEPSSTRVILLEAGPRILPPFTETLSAKAQAQLEELGAEVRTQAMVTNIDQRGVHLGSELIAASTVIWAAGVRASPLTEGLGVALDRAGRIIVEGDCSIPGHAEVFAIGDIAFFKGPDGKPLPGVSPVAMQQGRCVAKNIVRTLKSEPRVPFQYFDKGTMATIGRSKAVAQLHTLGLSGFLAWLSWLFVHIWYLIGFRNRFVVLFTWFWSYMTYKRGARLITGRILTPGQRPSASALESDVEPRKEGLGGPAERPKSALVDRA